jgi:hypothetical protein
MDHLLRSIIAAGGINDGQPMPASTMCTPNSTICSSASLIANQLKKAKQQIQPTIGERNLQLHDVYVVVV